MIQIQDLRLAFGNKIVLDGFSARLPLEGVTSIQGPSGCGKTTLLRVLAGLEKPQSGRVTGLPARIGFLFQDDRLLPWCTAAENVAAVLPKGERTRVGDYLRLVELEGEGKSLPGQLSGGMRRRVALARTLAFGGELLLLDEPFKGMDEALTERLAARLTALGIPILAVAHGEKERQALGGRCLRLDGPPLRVV